ncbi:fused MFS/spermidine synthase [Occallatibacter riparius]|uniref:Fused MFS/spermidine synthase n=1 Tax=Occallatibacter riparius TaxID=1002689 RepID=A0A9J7BN96_9BACT|nr:fused MFS/spermidine synthase [Occallatibacter riparius]UWZ84364.1 fused MFS/spermidine synthase [Occallatibacter riparius]
MTQVRFLFGGAVFLAAFLLFLVEPIAARQLLPVLGGSASVWITCLVFFQTALLVGYLYAHWLSQRPRSVLVLILLAAAVATAIAWSLVHPDQSQGAGHPIWTVFRVLGAYIGIPFIVLSATSPLLQVWWARSESSQVPYRLYALSNLASFLALAAYPALVEPNLTLHNQRLVWCSGFLVFAALLVLLAFRMRGVENVSAKTVEPNAAAPTASFADKLLWVLLPMGATMQLSTVTAYITANVAAIPLLWILPLGVYLLTLILAFQFRLALPWNIIARIMVVLLGGLAYSLHNTNAGWPLWVSLLFFLGELFFACIFCHVEAVRLRPERPSEVTLFYLLFAAGGAIGSFLIGIAAPLLFDYNLDLPLTFLVTALLALAVNWRSGWNQRLLWGVASVAMVAVTFMVRHSYSHNTTVATRNFYASLRVTQDLFSYPGATVRTLMNGSIQHGTQIFGTDDLRRTPTTYYARNSGVGLAMQYCCLARESETIDPQSAPQAQLAAPQVPQRPMSIGVIGLGAGTMAAYGRAGDRIRFYEINPAVVPIARNVFTYIRDSPAQIDIIQGDARNSLASEPPQHFDVLVVDAFSGDAIPIHLLTAEALALYRKHLNPNGILAFHISNRHVDLAPPIALLAQSAGMQARRFDVNSPSGPGEYVSTWMLVTADPQFFELPDIAPHAHMTKPRPGLKLWTDDYSALLPVLRW